MFDFIDEKYFLISGKQQILFKWLLETLGFVDDELTMQYVTGIKTRKYRTTRQIPATMFAVIYVNNGIHTTHYENQINQLKQYGFSVWKGDIQLTLSFYELFKDAYVPKKYSVLDFLFDELRMKTKRLFKRYDYINNGRINATDIATYTYCPIAYIISKSFVSEKIITTIAGNEQHEETILKNLLLKFNKGFGNKSESYQLRVSEFYNKIVNDINKGFLNDIMYADLIETGHSGDFDFYYNSELNFSGMPDYVYQSINKRCFVVEEKFILKKESDNIEHYPPWENHTNQLSAYISFINKIDIEYGYLVYWFYYFNDEGKPIVYACKSHKIEKSLELNTKMMSILNEIRIVPTNNEYPFTRNADRIKKCRGCVYNRICGHKTGQYNSYKFPYEFNYWDTNDIPFPIADIDSMHDLLNSTD